MSLGRSARSGRQAITNARIVTPDRVIEDGYVTFEDDRILDVGTGRSRRHANRIDADGRLVLPGIVDLHGDDVERYLYPRNGARVDTRTALLACDRANIAAGITTKLHAVAFEDAPDEERSVSLAKEVIDAAARLDGLLADNRIHARCELGEAEAVEGVLEAIGREIVDLVSLMHHRPGTGQFDDVEAFNRRYTDGGLDPAGDDGRVIERRAKTSRRQLEGRASRVIRAARSAGIEVASHDDEDGDRLERLHDWGVSISEYPVSMAAARRASRLGMVTAMGAPNLVRGGSLWDNLAASTGIDAGVVDVLCSDYHPPSLLESVFVETDEPLEDRVRRVTKAPADAVGFDARGRIEPGARADLIVVDPDDPPRVGRAFVAGSEIYRAGERP